ncbi:PH domain-containing protein [Phytomonospora sp. NPDC050363]|uniref:PH domain-containing protein n=1 Tax=Phytomonospora sp. NPDC050363 TaxID=3155642 RepID=UPI0033EE34EC
MTAPPVVRLRPPRFRVDPRARRWWTVQALVVFSGPALLAACTLLVLSVLFFPGALPWLAPLLAITCVIPGLAYLIAMPRLRYRVHAWELGEDALYAASGWWWRKHRITPLSRVQTVDTVQGPIQRAFGLASVTMTTASTAAQVTVAGLSRADAEQLAARIGESARLERRDAA